MLHKKPTFYLAVLGVGATVALVLRLQGQSPIAAPPIEPPARPYVRTVAATGIVEALSENVALGVPEPGLVTAVHVKVWDRVADGQPLFALDDRDLRAQLTVNEANVAVATATVRRLRDQLDRLRSVSDARAVSAEEVRTRENDVAVAQAQLDAALARAAHNRVQLARLTVRAPRAGTILQINVRPGEYAAAAPRTAAMLLGDLTHLQVRAEVDEQNAARLQPGQAATAYVKGDTTRPIELAFVRIEPFVVPKTALTGAGTERVDTRVLQVIYAFRRPEDRAIYVGQQVDLFVKSDEPSASDKIVATATAATSEKGRL